MPLIIIIRKLEFNAFGQLVAQIAISSIALIIAFNLVACSGDISWNNPYPVKDKDSNILYSSFKERPKHLDPAQSYASNEVDITGQVYEPPLQYHFLKRPYELIPLTSTDMPKAKYYDKDGYGLSDDANNKLIAFSVYEIRINPGVMYQPHPAFAKTSAGEYLYHDLTERDIADKYSLKDFPATGSRELLASDYVHQIKRLAHPSLHSPIFGFMSKYIVGLPEYGKHLKTVYKKQQQGDGKNAFLDLQKYHFDGVQLVDKYTYQIKIKGKYPQFLYWLAMPFFAPIPPEADIFYSQPGMKKKNISLDWYPVGTGPYMLTENNPNLQIILEKNPNFHGETYPTEGENSDGTDGFLIDAGKPIPFIDKVVRSLEKESIPLWNKFLQGYYDASGISSDSFDQAINFGSQGDINLSKDMQSKGIKLITSVETSTYYMGFNMNDPIVGGYNEQARKLRQAISIAIDYEEFISIFRNGRGVLAQGPIPPGIFGFRDGEAGVNRYIYDWVDGKANRKSIEYAKQLLNEAGYPDGRYAKTGEPLVIYYDTASAGPGGKSILDWYRKQFRKLDIQLEIRGTDYNRFQEKMRKGKAQMFGWGWNADYPDPENFLFLLYGPNGRIGKNGANSANYASQDFDLLFENMKNMDNTPQRLDIIDQMIEIARKDNPWVWGFHPKQFSLYHSWYNNAKPNLMANNTLKYKRIDPAIRSQQRALWNKPIVWPFVLLTLIFLLSFIPAINTYRAKSEARGVR